MNVEIIFKIAGKELSADALGDSPKAKIHQYIRLRMVDKLRNLRCDQHGEFPRVLAEGDDLDNLHWSVTGCCESLKDAALRVLQLDH